MYIHELITKSMYSMHSDVLESIYSPIIDTFKDFLAEMINYFPKIVFASIVLIMGYIIGMVLGDSIKLISSKIFGLDTWIQNKNLKKSINDIELSTLAGDLVKWYTYIFFINVAISRFGDTGLKTLFNEITWLYPKLVALIVVGLFGLVFSEWITKRIIGPAGKGLNKDLSSVFKFLILVMLLLFSLELLNFEVGLLTDTVRLAFIGFVGIISISIGIGLGFGLKDEFKPYLKRYLADRFGKKRKSSKA